MFEKTPRQLTAWLLGVQSHNLLLTVKGLCLTNLPSGGVCYGVIG